MNIKPIHANFCMPTRGSKFAGAYDLYMPEGGYVNKDTGPVKAPLGFAAEIPTGYVALLLPRSGVGTKYGIELQNTCGVIDSDYRGQWYASIGLKGKGVFVWSAGERLLQMLLLPVFTPDLYPVDALTDTMRGAGGFGSTGA